MTGTVRGALVERIKAQMDRQGLSARAVGVAACANTRPVYKLLRGESIRLSMLEQLEDWCNAAEHQNGQ